MNDVLSLQLLGTGGFAGFEPDGCPQCARSTTTLSGCSASSISCDGGSCCDMGVDQNLYF